LGEEQLVKLPESSLHSKVAPGSSEDNTNVAELEAVVPLGPESIVVSGAVASIVHVRVAGLESTLPAASIALTVNVCAPSDRPV
jgi:hypothetical protein